MEGDPAEVLPALVAAAETPATGDAQKDLLVVVAELESTLAPAPAKGSARKLLMA